MPQSPQTYADPYTLPGTQITGLTSAFNAFSANVHRQSKLALTLAELWFYKDGNWILSPAPLCMTPNNHPVLRKRIREPATLDAMLLDQNAQIAPTNLASPYNQDPNGNYEPLITEARQVLLRVGTFCYTNLVSGLTATASSGTNAPSGSPSPSPF